MSSKKKNIQTINGNDYFTKRALMPDGSWKMDMLYTIGLGILVIGGTGLLFYWLHKGGFGIPASPFTSKKVALILLATVTIFSFVVFIETIWDNTPEYCDDLVGYIIKLDKDEGKSPYIVEITDIKNYGLDGYNRRESVNEEYLKLVEEWREDSISNEEYSQRRTDIRRKYGTISCKGNAVLDNGLQGEIYFYDKTTYYEKKDNLMQILITRNSSTKIGYETSNFK